MVVVSTGVTYVLPVSPAIGVPPVATVYQRNWPLVPPDAVSVADDGEQVVTPTDVGAKGGKANKRIATLETTCEAMSPLTLHLKPPDTGPLAELTVSKDVPDPEYAPPSVISENIKSTPWACHW